MKDFLEMYVDVDLPSLESHVVAVAGRTTLHSVVLDNQNQQQLQKDAGSDPAELNLWKGTTSSKNSDSLSGEDDSVWQHDELPVEELNTSIQTSQLETVDNTKHSLLNALLNPFSIGEQFTLPVPFATLSTEQLLQQEWINELKQILVKIPQGLAPVSIVSSDYKYRNVLINWMVAAKTQVSPPLQHVIVFSLDKALCELLKRRNFHCVFVALSSYLTPKTIASLTKHIAFSEVMVLRQTAVRLMNHWGYDIANYDTDAIVLKNPESLFLRHTNSHMIGSYGHYPGELSRVWGTAVCYGFFLIRSSPYTGLVIRLSYAYLLF